MLCEKPFAITAADAAACFDAAEVADRLCIEGLMWRHHPQTRLAQQLVDDGAIGRLSHIRAALSVNVAPGETSGGSESWAAVRYWIWAVTASAGIRLFGGQPLRVSAAQVVDTAEGADGGDLRLAATFALPGDALAQFDVALDFPRRDELELIGANGKITIPDPWLCRYGYLELERGGVSERLSADPSGRFRLSSHFDNDDAYRIEFQNASLQITGGTAPTFGRADAIDQAAAIEAVRQAATTGTWIAMPAPTAPNTSTHGEPS